MKVCQGRGIEKKRWENIIKEWATHRAEGNI